MIKIKNNKLLKNIIILLSTGAIAKILGMISKIVYTRVAGLEIVSLYALITPTFMLIISITQFSFPISISKISSEDKYDNNNLLFNAYIIGIIIDIILMIIIFFSSNMIAKILNNYMLSSTIKSTIFIIPLVTISSIQRGFLHGKEDMFIPSVTNVLEEIIKMIMILILLPIFVLKGNIEAVIFLILINIFTEITTIIFLQKKIKKYYKSNKHILINKTIIKEILSISIPTTLVRLVSSIGFFLEPIILTNVLISEGFNNNYIVMEYGIITSYIVPLLSMPIFFSTAIASALLPNITKAYYNKKYNEFKNKLFKLLNISMIIGLICLVIILSFPKQILELIYNINIGINYLYFIGPFFLLLYMQPTLSVALQSMNKTSELLKISIITMTTKYGLLYLLCKNGYGMKSFLYSIIIGIVITTILMIYNIIKKPK